jgi:hypothetical protein
MTTGVYGLALGASILAAWALLCGAREAAERREVKAPRSA